MDPVLLYNSATYWSIVIALDIPMYVHLTVLCWLTKTFLTVVIFWVARYGFRSPPHLELKARPKLGERVVTLAHVTDWIEKKLDQEFQVKLTLTFKILF